MSSRRRPAHLTQENAAAFQLASVVESYGHRTPFPDALAPFLHALMRRPDPVLELGCGTGETTRALAPLVERIDAIDVSEPMLAKARTLPGGDNTAIRWIYGTAEDAPLEGPYSLALAGDALHWMDWDIVLPRVERALLPGAHLAIVNVVTATPPWEPAMRDVIRRYSVMQDFEPFDLPRELESRRLFRTQGDETIGSQAFTRTIDEYIDGLHATAGMPRERMGGEHARAFDDLLRAILRPFAVDEVLELDASAHVVWGAPLAPAKGALRG